MAPREPIVEDERDIRDLILLHLQRDGYQVTTAGSGEDALLQVKQSPPDLVLLDLMLPGMSGLEVCRRLRQEPTTAGLPILMLTAKVDEVDRVVGLELGADDYVVKPFSPKELVARVRAVLRRSRPGRAAARLRCTRGRRGDAPGLGGRRAGDADAEGVRSPSRAGRGARPRALARVPPRSRVGLHAFWRDRVPHGGRARAAASHEAR